MKSRLPWAIALSTACLLGPSGHQTFSAHVANAEPSHLPKGTVSVKKVASCTWYVTLKVTGLSPRAHIQLSSHYSAHNCETGAVFSASWGPKKAGDASATGTWIYRLSQVDYGSYRYTVISDRGKTQITFAYVRGAIK
jgi:hypothetical protein